MNNSNFSTKRLVESALLIAIATLLSFIKIFELPFGGSITLCSMLPMVLLSYRYGIKWGVFAAFIGSLIQLFVGLGAFKGVTPWIIIGSIIFDYLVAFTVLGLGGLFRNATKSASINLAIGCLFATLLRFASSFISGFIFFGEYAEWFFSQEGFTFGATILDKFFGPTLNALYSLIYNGMYMIPEIIITTIVIFILGASRKLQEKF